MNRIIHELRRREVFRTAGLYVGICWIGIEVASVILPAFGAPDWILQALIIAVMIGFPIMIVFAWVYDVTSRGIEVTPDATETVVLPFGKSRGDLIVIGVLSVALIISVYLNITGRREPVLVETPDPLSVLVADFDNQTGDPLFDGSLEQTMMFGIEGASFITAYNRASALAKAEQLITDGKGGLGEDAARLVAVREGVQLVLSGEVSEDRGRYEFAIYVVEPDTGDEVIAVSETAGDKSEALGTVSELARRVREGLGDTSLKGAPITGTETFTAATLAAAKAYTKGQFLAYDGDYDGAIEQYRLAVDEDPRFGRAYSGWALAAFTLGRTDEAEELWQKALTFMDTMTDRERYRTLGLYYMAVSGNYPEAIESYEALVEKYPADGAGHNNLAVAYFSTLDFERALVEGQRVLDIYPSNLFYQQNYALYAMYASDFERAESRGRAVLAEDPSRFYSRLPVAIAELARGDAAAAEATYTEMAAVGDAGASLAATGQADIAQLKGNYEQAIDWLRPAIETDTAAGNNRGAAAKTIALAQALAASGESESVGEVITKALALNGGLAQQVPAALIYIEAGDVESASAIADELTGQVQAQRRAYGHMIRGILESRAGRHGQAVEAFREAIDEADFWLVRYYLGQAYLAAGAPVEALDEFDTCQDRIGEAAALFLDDSPTWRYTAELPYWRGRAQEAVGMTAGAKSSYGVYIASRPDDDPLVADARARMTRPSE